MVGKRTMQDELRPEYDLRNLQVRTVAPNRKRYGRFVVHLEPDVAKAFPNAASVNEALRFLIRLTKENKESLPNHGDKHLKVKICRGNE